MKAFMKKIKNFKSETKAKMSLSKKFSQTKDLFLIKKKFQALDVENKNLANLTSPGPAIHEYPTDRQ